MFIFANGLSFGNGIKDPELVSWGGGDEPFIIDKEVYLYTLKALMGESHNWSWFVLEESGVLKCG